MTNQRRAAHDRPAPVVAGGRLPIALGNRNSTAGHSASLRRDPARRRPRRRPGGSGGLAAEAATGPSATLGRRLQRGRSGCARRPACLPAGVAGQLSSRPIRGAGARRSVVEASAFSEKASSEAALARRATSALRRGAGGTALSPVVLSSGSSFHAAVLPICTPVQRKKKCVAREETLSGRLRSAPGPRRSWRRRMPRGSRAGRAGEPGLRRRRRGGQALAVSGGQLERRRQAREPSATACQGTPRGCSPGAMAGAWAARRRRRRGPGGAAHPGKEAWARARLARRPSLARPLGQRPRPPPATSLLPAARAFASSRRTPPALVAPVVGRGPRGIPELVPTRARAAGPGGHRRLGGARAGGVCARGEQGVLLAGLH